MRYLLEANRVYELHQLANDRGHDVIVLPPHNCEYNSIRLVWAEVEEVADKKKFTLAEADKLVNEDL